MTAFQMPPVPQQIPDIALPQWSSGTDGGRSKPKPGPLLIPQRWRINRQIKQRDVVRQCVVQDGRHDVGCQRGQVDHPADVAVVDSFPRGDLLQGLRLA